MENIIAGIFGLLIGITGIVTGFVQLRNLAALKSWGKTSGKVIERGTFKVTHANRSPPAFQFAPLVKYVYNVDGQEFINDSIAPKHIELPRHNTIEWAEKRAAAFPDEPVVFYNPKNPADSFLVPTSKRTLYIVVGVSFLVCLVSLIFFF